MMEPKHEVVVSGISGIFPESDDMEELCHNLYNKVDMVTTDSRRWVPGELGVPPGTGKIKCRDLLDYQFFGVGIKMVESMDPLVKMSLEQAYRAVCDSGMSLNDVVGSNTAVYVASAVVETEDLIFTRVKEQGHYSMLGNARTMHANRISYVLNFTGPSTAIVSCWNGGMEALELGYQAVATGESVAAVVGCSSAMFNPHISYHYDAMGRLSQDSATRSFSCDADGYARSEGCVFLFLQRADQARRSYGTILGVSSMYFGSRDLNFTEFSAEKYKEFLKDVYRKAKVDPAEVAYFEASGVASKAVDALELNAAADVFLSKRQKPLLIGSIKSNLGHTEGAASLVALTKAIIAMDKGIIPPNLNYKSPNPNIPALVSGKFKVVTEPTPLEGDVVGVSSYGIAGSYAHVIMKRNCKAKAEIPDEKLPLDGLPRLVLLSDRLPENISGSISKLNGLPIDKDFVDLMNNFVRDGIRNHMARGYCIQDGTANKYHQVEAYSPGSTKRPIWFVFSGMGSQWSGMGKSLMTLPVFANAIQKCHKALLTKNMDLIDVITNEDPKTFDNILNAFVGIAAVQIGLTDVLRSVGVEPDGMVGHSLGEQGCGYADGCFTAEEMILSAYGRGKASLDATLIRGMMAAVGKGYQQLKDQLPQNVEIACHNSKDSCTLSGPSEDIKAFVEQLKEKGVFTKLVNVGDIAFHSKYIKPAGGLLLQYLNDVIHEPKQRTSRWISSSIPQSQWGTKLAQYCSAEYHVNNMKSPVLFEEASAFIPADAVVIEIAPHGLLQSILKRSIPTALHVPLTNRFDGDSLKFLLSALGKLYTAGVPINVAKLYPPVEYPVPRGTPYLSPFVGWNHREEFSYVASREDAGMFACWKILDVDLSEDRFRNLVNHKLGSKFIIPNSFHVDQLIRIFTEHNGKPGSGVVIQDLIFDNFCETAHNHKVAITVKVLQGTGEFCITGERRDILLSKGKIKILDPKNVDWGKHVVELSLENTSWEIDGSNFLSLLQYEGLELTSGFALIKKVIIGDNKIKAAIKWNQNLTEFLTSVFTIVGYCEGKKSQKLLQVKSVQELVIDTVALGSQSDSDVIVEYNMDTKSIHCGGMRIVLHETAPFKMESFQEDGEISFEIPHFIPYTNPRVQCVSQVLEISAQLVLENLTTENKGIVKVMVIGSSLKEALLDVFGSPKYAADFDMRFYSSKTEFLEPKSLDSVNESAALVVSSSAVGLLYAAKSSTKTFILAPDFESNDEWATISAFELDGTSYTLAQPACQIHYEIVPLGVGMSVLEQTLSDANEKNVEENCDGHIVFLTSNINSVSLGMEIIEETSSLKYNHLLRYMLTENSAVDIASYRDQIKKNVKVNVNLNGVWGSLRALSVEPNEELPSDDIYTKVPVHQISSIVPSSDVVALGVNLGDPTGSTEDDFIRVFDYVSPMVIGLAKYDQVLNKFVKDDILEWSRPRYWSDTQAATVPVLYSLAAYIVHIVNNQAPGDSILINRGMIPLSQALISLSLSARLDVFVTVFGSEEKKVILQKFPELKSDQIFDCNTSSFHIPILKHTKGEGVYKVVNTFPDDIMIGACIKCTSIRGTYVQVSAAPMLKNSKMGMLFFDYEVIACGATVDIVMSLPVEQKMEIKDFVNRALLSGHVVPCDNVLLLPPNISNIDAAKQMSFVQSKVVVDLKCQSKDHLQVFICEPDGNYVIVADQLQSHFWLKLTEWLLRRGARKINVVLKTPTLSPEITLRIQSLNEKYPPCRIHIHPASRLASKSAVKQFVNDSDSGSNLRTVFLIGSAVKDISAILNEVLLEQGVQCELVCLGRGGERLSERLKNGLRSISIRCTPAVLEMPSFLQRLDGLISKARKHSVVTANRYSIQRFTKPANEWTRIPTTLAELQELSHMISRTPTFVEMASHSPRLAENKECDPVFVFPGLRPGRTRRIASRMTFPVLVAQLPKGFVDMESLASELAHQMASRRQNVFTLIGVEWGGTLALHTASKLQSLGKLATVILLDGAPATTSRWAAKLIADDLVLLSKYTKLPPEMMARIKEHPTWEMKRDALLECCEPANSQTIENVSLVRNRLQEVLTAKPPAQKVRILSHLFRYGQLNKNDFGGLNEYLTKKPVIHTKEAASVSEMIDKAMDDVNSFVTYEHKDAARPQPEDLIGSDSIAHNLIAPALHVKAKIID